MKKDYKALSLSYQPCNMPQQAVQPEKKSASRRQRRSSAKYKTLMGFAAKNKTRMTPSEKALDVVLSETLPRHNLKHFPQHVAGSQILDFAIPSKRLAIEVDGLYHFFNGRKDAFRTKLLSKRGWRVIRFTNHDVNTDITQVVKDILAACGSEFEITE